MKQKKPSSLARILGYAGGHKNLTILGCVLIIGHCYAVGIEVAGFALLLMILLMIFPLFMI